MSGISRPYYDDAGIVIYHGDCHAIAPGLAGVGALISDPPYGMKDRTMRVSAGRGKSTSTGFRFVAARDWPAIYGDDQPFDPAPWLGYRTVVLFGANHYSSRLPQSRCWLVWDKRDGTTSDDNADCEFAWTNIDAPARLYRQLWRGICRRGEENISSSRGLEHPSQKPVALMRWVLQRCALNAADVVLDPFMGSGSTLVAAKREGLRAIGIEIDERYCEVAARRLAQGVLNLRVGADPDPDPELAR